MTLKNNKKYKNIFNLYEYRNKIGTKSYNNYNKKSSPYKKVKNSKKE